MHLRESKVLNDAALVGAFTVLVKLAGAAKVVASAHFFGAGDQVDAFLIAFVIPTFLGEVLAGSLTSALIPTLIHVREREGEDAAHGLSSTILIGAVAVLLCVAAIAGAGSGVVVRLLGSGFSAEKAHLTRMLFLCMTPVIPLAGISIIWRSVLNSKEKFAAAACVPVVTPLLSIAILILAGHALGAFSLALGATIGSLTEVILLSAALRVHGIRIRPVAPKWTQPARLVVTQYIPMAVGSVMLSGSNVIDQTMAAMLPAGSVSALNYGTRVAGVIQAVGPMALSTAILPRLSRMTAVDDRHGLRQTLKSYGLLSLALSIPTTLLLMYFSGPVVRVIFQRGVFSTADADVVTQVQRWSLLQVPISMILALLVRLVSSLKLNELLLRMAVVSVAANFALDYVLMRRMGVAGIALATPFVSLLSTGFLAFLLWRRIRTRS